MERIPRTVMRNHAQSLRKDMTKEERKLWYDFIKPMSLPFHRQTVFGNYIVDFYCATKKLVVELDGSQHFDNDGRASDEIRDKFLSEMGLTVLRYANSDVNSNFAGVCEDILEHMQ